MPGPRTPGRPFRRNELGQEAERAAEAAHADQGRPQVGRVVVLGDGVRVVREAHAGAPQPVGQLALLVAEGEPLVEAPGPVEQRRASASSWRRRRSAPGPARRRAASRRRTACPASCSQRANGESRLGARHDPPEHRVVLVGVLAWNARWRATVPGDGVMSSPKKTSTGARASATPALRATPGPELTASAVVRSTAGNRSPSSAAADGRVPGPVVDHDHLRVRVLGLRPERGERRPQPIRPPVGGHDDREFRSGHT